MCWTGRFQIILYNCRENFSFDGIYFTPDDVFSPPVTPENYPLMFNLLKTPAIPTIPHPDTAEQIIEQVEPVPIPPHFPDDQQGQSLHPDDQQDRPLHPL